MDWPSLLRSPRFVWVLLPALWAAAYLPSAFSRDLRLEEGRRAMPAREMAQSGNFVLPTLHGQPYLSKPPLYFWLTAFAGIFTGGVNEVAVRIPAALGALAGALVVFGFAAGRLAPQTRALAALLSLSSFIVLDKGTLGELETVFSTLVLAAVAVWFNGEAAGGLSMRRWIAVGALLSAAMLVKGPPALLLFYIPVVVHLFGVGRLRSLLSLGHAAAFALAAGPLLIWAWAVTASRGVQPAQAVGWWVSQMRMGPGEAGGRLVQLVEFPAQTALMLMPWGVAAIPMFRRVWSQRLPNPAMPDDLRRFLVRWVLATAAVFCVWPHSRARYVMVLIYPTCLLAAAAIQGLAGADFIRRRDRLLVFAVRFWSLLPVIAAGAALLFAAFVALPSLPWTAAGLIAWTVAATAVLRWSTATPRPALLPATCAAAAVASLSVAGALALSARPYHADFEATRRTRTQLAAAVPTEGPVYTLFTHPERDGHGLTDYNTAFYFGSRIVPLRVREGQVEPFDPALPPNTPCFVLGSAVDREMLSKLPGVSVRIAATISTRSTTDPLLVMELTWSPRVGGR